MKEIVTSNINIPGKPPKAPITSNGSDYYGKNVGKKIIDFFIGSISVIAGFWIITMGNGLLSKLWNSIFASSSIAWSIYALITNVLLIVFIIFFARQISKRKRKYITMGIFTTITVVPLLMLGACAASLS